MPHPPFIVGPTGLPVLQYQDWREDVVVVWQFAWGADVPTEPTTKDGFWIDILTLRDQLQGDSTQSVYANSFFRTADDVGLDLIVDFFGRKRLPARPTVVDVVWYGTAGTLVYSGTGPGAPVVSVLTSTASNGDRYQTAEGESGTIPLPSDLRAIMVVRINAVTDGNLYPLDIDATELTSFPTAGPADTPTTIALALALDLLAEQSTWVISTPGLDPSGQALIVIEGKAAEVVTVGANVTNAAEMDVFPAVRLDANAEVTGPQIALAGTVITIETPAAGLEGVTTTADGLLGRDLETSTELRRRHIDQLNSVGKCTPQSIRAALLELLPSPLVEFARVDEALGGDLTLVGPPAFTIPGGAYTVTVIGTATDQQIGDIIFDQRPAGVESFGPVETVSTDELGDTHSTFFARGSEEFLHLTISIVTGEGFPTVGDPAATIRAAVTAGLLEIEDMGQDIVRVFVESLAVQSVPGITEITVRTDATPQPGDTPIFTAADVIVAAGQVVRTDSSRIAVAI